MGSYAVQEHGEIGAAVTFGAVVEAGDTIALPEDGTAHVMRWKNSGAGSHVVTIAGSGNDSNGLPNPALAITIVNGGLEITSCALRAARFGGTATMTYDASSTGEVTAAFVHMNDDKGIT